ncbi:hypothetical protein HanPI659440_Chr15g0595601 [Helianthus annuus]|nr:hypothetical protein HanPI659440_Chr15g0595601 [Helianthus annuus]
MEWIVSLETSRHVGATSSREEDHPLGDYPRVWRTTQPHNKNQYNILYHKGGEREVKGERGEGPTICIAFVLQTPGGTRRSPRGRCGTPRTSRDGGRRPPYRTVLFLKYMGML